MYNITFKDWLIIKENKRKLINLINLDKTPEAPKGDEIIIKLGKFQPDTLFSDRGHIHIKNGGAHEKNPTRGEENIKWNKDQDYLK